MSPDKEDRRATALLLIMKIQRYQDSGYINFKSIYENDPATVLIFVGARGTGKTENALEYLLSEKIGFLFVRRTVAEEEMMVSECYSPLVPLNQRIGSNYNFFRAYKSHKLIYEADGEGNPTGEKLALTSSLSGGGKRGIDGTWMDCLLYDEFIPDTYEAKIKDEYGRLMNLYETINRNREITGRKAARMILMSNANTLYNDILIGLGIVNEVSGAFSRGDKRYSVPGRNISVYNFEDSPIAKKKGLTAIYSIDNGRYGTSAIKNKFPEHSKSTIRSIPIRELSPLCRVGEIEIYTWKNGGYYVSPHFMDCRDIYGTSDAELLRFATKYYFIRRAYIDDKIIFESPSMELLLDKYLSIT